ncbi:hypothetical protein BC834DRAFT_824448 [Gloeopeniophorella convolvens]|nr:hypothetical protein BC834DRAFT_824448 [Gloeopeniophorella convolvens]
MASTFEEFMSNVGKTQGALDDSERWWIQRQAAIEEAGYRFRPRYREGWKPSWEGTNRSYLDFEDGQGLTWRVCMDATRIADGQTVMLKRIPLEEGSYELEINRKFSAEPLVSNPRNHCAQLLDVIELPGDPPIMVHAFLRPFDDPPFETYGEFVAFFGQLCEGVQFMHENHVAHRDCTKHNIMLDPSDMYPELFHPTSIDRNKDFGWELKQYSRTKCPPRYLLIDFGLSREYNPQNGPPREIPLRGGDKSAPEHQDMDIPCDPFLTDVYYLGNLVQEELMKNYGGLGFMLPLVNDMVREDPTKRPTMDEVVDRFAKIRKKLGGWKLRSRMSPKKEVWFEKVMLTAQHWYRTVGYVFTFTPAIPQPK